MSGAAGPAREDLLHYYERELTYLRRLGSGRVRSDGA